MKADYWLHALPPIPPEESNHRCLITCRLTAPQKKSGRCEEYKYPAPTEN